MSSCLTSTLRLATRRLLTQNQASLFHTTPSTSIARNSDGNFNVTMVPGDRVGPELMDSVQAVLKSINAPLTFDQLHLSEVQHRTSTRYAMNLPIKSIFVEISQVIHHFYELFKLISTMQLLK